MRRCGGANHTAHRFMDRERCRPRKTRWMTSWKKPQARAVRACPRDPLTKKARTHRLPSQMGIRVRYLHGNQFAGACGNSPRSRLHELTLSSGNLLREGLRSPEYRWPFSTPTRWPRNAPGPDRGKSGAKCERHGHPVCGCHDGRHDEDHSGNKPSPRHPECV